MNTKNVIESSEVYAKVSNFCQEVKRHAKRFSEFNKFIEFVNAEYKGQTTLKKVDFNRLVQVAAMEAELA